MKKIGLCVLILIIFQSASAQTATRYIVKFKDKKSSPFSLSNPSQYLSQKSITRRTRYSIALDSTDLPVNENYINGVKNTGAVTILNASRWLNQISIQTTDAAALNAINNLPYVHSVYKIAARLNNQQEDKKWERTESSSTSSRILNSTANYFNYGASFNQIHIHNAEFLHNIGLRGQNMNIGMLDAGYLNYQSVTSLDSARKNGQILDTWDFVVRNNSVNEDASHGMQCLTVIAANLPGTFVGSAPKANFYLYRSEDAATEYPIEEHNWVCAAERVDSAGGDVISSSLGYTRFDDPVFNHSYASMNGNTTMAAIGADLAAKKGILVFNAAGNDGGNSWRYISTPADGDSVVAVGAVDVNGNPAGFSSFGPSSDGQIKPDVASVGAGTIVQYAGGTIAPNNGTSFACPNMAGVGTCLWQGFQEFNNMKIVAALKAAGSIANAPNDKIGYGIPDAKKALMMLLQDFSTATANFNNCRSNISWTSKDVSSMKYEIERKLPGETAYTKIAEQSGTGTIFNNHTYQFADLISTTQTGSINYRIKQIIDTAAATFTANYIDSVSVQVNGNCTAQTSSDFVVLPNPVKANFSVRINLESSVQTLNINIINAAGAVVYKQKSSANAGSSDINFPVLGLASGKYFITVYDGNKLLGKTEFIKL